MEHVSSCVWVGEIERESRNATVLNLLHFTDETKNSLSLFSRSKAIFGDDSFPIPTNRSVISSSPIPRVSICYLLQQARLRIPSNADSTVKKVCVPPLSCMSFVVVVDISSLFSLLACRLLSLVRL